VPTTRLRRVVVVGVATDDPGFEGCPLLIEGYRPQCAGCTASYTCAAEAPKKSIVARCKPAHGRVERYTLNRCRAERRKLRPYPARKSPSRSTPMKLFRTVLFATFSTSIVVASGCGGVFESIFGGDDDKGASSSGSTSSGGFGGLDSGSGEG